MPTKAIRLAVTCGFVTGLLAGPAGAQTAAGLAKDAYTPDNVLTLGMGHGQQRYSPLVQLNKKSVKRLVPVWNYALGNNRGQESQPLIYNGVMYVTTHDKTHAINTKTGRQL